MPAFCVAGIPHCCPAFMPDCQGAKLLHCQQYGIRTLLCSSSRGLAAQHSRKGKEICQQLGIVALQQISKSLAHDVLNGPVEVDGKPLDATMIFRGNDNRQPLHSLPRFRPVAGPGRRVLTCWAGMSLRP